ncbi:MAG: hypothetical protein AAF657_26400 [Acidobacteriota bacterium]
MLVLLGAVASSVLTLGLGFLFFDRYYKRRLEREMDERFSDYSQRLQATIAEEAEKAGDSIAKKVRVGVVEGITSIPSSEVLQGTTQNVVKTGVDLVEAGLSTFLGAKSRKR